MVATHSSTSQAQHASTIYLLASKKKIVIDLNDMNVSTLEVEGSDEIFSVGYPMIHLERSYTALTINAISKHLLQNDSLFHKLHASLVPVRIFLWDPPWHVVNRAVTAAWDLNWQISDMWNRTEKYPHDADNNGPKNW
jgi:hypothetical protein